MRSTDRETHTILHGTQIGKNYGEEGKSNIIYDVQELQLCQAECWASMVKAKRSRSRSSSSWRSLLSYV